MKDLFFKTIMLKGEAGGTIASIEKTGSSLNVDTYTITLNDGETQTFEVTNGSSIASIEKTDTSGLLDTYTVTLTDGSTTQFVVRNGEDGAGYEVPAGSVLFYDPDGDDSAPEGYEASSDPNGAAIAALQRGLDNNLFFQGLLCAYKSEPVGWRTWVMSGTSPAFVENGGYLIYAGSKTLLYTPKFQPYTEFIGNVFDGATYSISVMYMSDQDGIVKTATQEALAWAQMPTEDIVDEDGIVIGLNSGIMNEVALFIENNTEEDLYILGVKLERGGNATPFRLEGQAVGSGTAIAQYIAKGSIIETSLADLESTLVSILNSMSNEEVKIYYFFPNFSSSAFFGGAPQIAILTRRESGVYRVALPNICGDMYYYSGSWHYSKATMSSVTP